jgi:ribulose-phosphate 3-epimerase
MSVNPGFGGQSFIPGAVRKVAEVAEMARLAGADVLVEVDGGVNSRTAPLVVGAGARVLVAGNAVFCSEDPAAAIAEIRESALRALL